ncbi:hypothetical protein LMG8286_01754 [Campylobacter suis]|uniref:Uncharacterized protein n=1 Tax=Campylobacter suis TaxID=2790657 RepID=A0ABN7K9W2_9BACT|nr:hypothetical protein LMG8286_01754 [Campylobacter suis]
MLIQMKKTTLGYKKEKILKKIDLEIKRVNLLAL